MARRSETFHVKDADGTLHEVALFDDPSDFPSPSSHYDRVRANGALAYIAATAQTMITSQPQTWLEEENGTGLYLRGYSGGNDYRVLEDPYYIHPLLDPVEFPADAGSVGGFGSNYVLLTDMVSTNGAYSSFSSDNADVVVGTAGAVGVGDDEIYAAAVTTANLTAFEKAFTLTLTYTFSDGSSKSRTLNCVQKESSGTVVGPLGIDGE